MKSYDRILLLLVSVVAIAFSVIMILKGLGFADRFAQDRPSQGDRLGESVAKKADVETSLAALSDRNTWKGIQVGEKKVQLMVSVPIIEKDGVIHDPLLDRPPFLRDPVPNRWFLKYKLPITRSDVLEMDQDKDGFNNKDEWNASTSPVDPAEHPPLTDKLVVLQRIAIPYTLKFSGAFEPTYQVTRMAPDRQNWFLEKDKTFEDGRFTVVGYEKKIVDAKDVSELTIKDNLRDELIVLVKGVEKELPKLFALFQYQLKGKTEIEVKRDDTFTLPNDTSGDSYLLKDISEEKAVIQKVGDESGKGLEILFAQ